MGTAAQFNGPESVAVDVDGNLFVADKHNHSVRKIAPDATVITLAGCNERGSADGPGVVADVRTLSCRFSWNRDSSSLVGWDERA